MCLRQKGQFFVHISKSGLKALYYKALSHFLPTLLSTMPVFFVDYCFLAQSKKRFCVSLSACWNQY
ncbi:hypothetical protein F9854_02820 [Glaesserella parasuis]|nr:hypothetical protein [Glaesserella parasuis]MWQ86442.1 hypothetical protein [Glaesserella parasuis]